MRKLKPSSSILKLTSLLLVVALACASLMGVAASADSKGKKGKDGDRNHKSKVSSDLKDKKSGGKKDSKKAEVIIQLQGKPTGRLNALLNSNGVHIRGQFDNLNMLSVELPTDVIDELASFDEVSYISSDREVVSLGYLSTTTGADSVRQQMSATGISYTLDGKGIGIAFLDSGIYSSHKSFTGRIAASKDYTGENRTDDPYGHGSHVIGIAAGNDSVQKGKYVGIAPGATIYNLRVLNSQGTGKVSSVLAALNDLLLYHSYYNIRIVNLSLGMPAIDSYKDDPICRAVRALVNDGMVVVAAAGNDGKDADGNKVYGLIHSPGNEPSALTIGASNSMGTVDRSDDIMTTYSSRGPTRGYWTDEVGVKHYDNLIKPDLVAPGNKIVAPEAVSNYIVKRDPTLDAGVSKFDNQKMMRLNGTSMATPVAAGAAALLLQVNPKLTPNMIKAILMYTAQPLANYNMFEQGAGEINIEGAVRLAKAFRTDLTASTVVGSPLLSTTQTPTPQTTLSYLNSLGTTSYTSFQWSQGIIADKTYATGTNLITKYQGVYGTGVLLSDGVLFTDGVLISDGVMFSDGVLFGDNILTSNGIAMSEGVPFMSTGVLFGDGVLFADGVLFGDGVIFSDGVLFGDGTIKGDYTIRAQSILLRGDKTLDGAE
ncbi:MAG: S8 family serine peptidase [Pyrinomonadaceae bacterium]|nr:S8 family serine peptidase [Pyrinomonadaceae bacterium]